ncbi:MAG: DUF805 domain-containing protein [Bacilli bacterium]|nr:DUF805 domain-containing protein [Bacilli bacterium]
MLDSYKRFWQNYANFKGRSTRADYWWVCLANFLIGFVLGFISGIIPDLAGLLSAVSSLYSLAVLVPTLALIVRRLHDINKSGWNYLFCLIPIAGPIIILVWFCTASVNENNQYGERV